MSTLKTTAILAIAATAIFASPAMAKDAPSEDKSSVTKAENTQVLAAIETANMIPVRDKDGNTFYNHYVPKSDLYDASIDHEVIDSYTYEYEGRIYTNTIVTE